MKNLLLLALVMLFGCTPTMYRETQSVGDFRKYTEEKFIISTSTSGFNYDPVGAIELTFHPGYVPKNGVSVGLEDQKVKEDAIYGAAGSSNLMINTSKYQWFAPTYDYMLSQLVDKAKQMGATGLLNLKITKHTTLKKYDEITTYVATGFAVKIL